MSITGIQQINETVTTSSKPAVPSNNEEIKLFDGEIKNNNQVKQTANNQEIVKANTTLRTKAQLEAAFLSIAKESGLTVEQVIKIAQLCSGRNTDLLNIDNDELNKVIVLVKRAIQKNTDKNGNVDIEKAANLAKNYRIQLENGWTYSEGINESLNKIDNATKNNDESLIERLYRIKTGIKLYTLPAKEREEKNKEIKQKFLNMSDKEKAELLKSYFGDYFNKLGKYKTKENVRRVQIQDFSKLLANTATDEERALFRGAVEYLAASNRYKGFEAVYNSFTEETNAVKFLDDSSENVKNIVATTDGFNDSMSEDDSLRLGQFVAKGQSYEGSKKFNALYSTDAAKFFEENKAALEIIAKKEAAKRKDFTPKEKALILMRDNYFKSVASGRVLGTAQNNVMTDEQKTEVLAEFVKTVHDLPSNISDAVIKQINTYIKSHPNEKILTTEQIKDIIEGVKTGSMPQSPSQVAETTEGTEAPSSQSSDLGYTISEEKPVVTVQLHETAEQESEPDKKQRELTKSEARKIMLAEVYKQTNKTVEDFKTLVNARLITMAEAITGAFEQASTSVQNWGKQQLALHDTKNGYLLNQVKISDREKVDMALQNGVSNINVCYTAKQELKQKQDDKLMMG